MRISDKTRLTERMHLMVSKHMKNKIVKEAENQEVAIAEVVRVAIDEYFEKRQK